MCPQHQFLRECELEHPSCWTVTIKRWRSKLAANRAKDPSYFATAATRGSAFSSPFQVAIEGSAFASATSPFTTHWHNSAGDETFPDKRSFLTQPSWQENRSKILPHVCDTWLTFFTDLFTRIRREKKKKKKGSAAGRKQHKHIRKTNKHWSCKKNPATDSSTNLQYHHMRLSWRGLGNTDSSMMWCELVLARGQQILDSIQETAVSVISVRPHSHGQHLSDL